MEGATPARLYATLAGALLVIAGIVGFFYTASFGGPGRVEDALGAFATNGWHNVLHIATGALGLLVAGYAARQYALWLGAAYTVLAVWGFALGAHGAIVGLIPVNAADNVVHLTLGVLGIAAAMTTPAPGARRSAAAARGTAA